MASPVVRDLLIGFGAGGLSGAFGVGGGIVLIPLLVLLLHVAQKRAQATSLVMVTLAGAAGSITYAIAGEVAWIPAAFILIGGMAGSLIGSSLVKRTSDHRLQIGFGILLIAVAVRLLLPVATQSNAEFVNVSAMAAVGFVLSGLAMGVLSALFGVGGGIILIPIIVTVFGFPQQLAAGTSLTVMAPIALLGAWRQSRTGATDWRMGLRFGVASIPGSVIGALAAVNASGSVLRVLFALLLIVIGLRMVIEGWRTRRST